MENEQQQAAEAVRQSLASAISQFFGGGATGGGSCGVPGSDADAIGADSDVLSTDNGGNSTDTLLVLAGGQILPLLRRMVTAKLDWDAILSELGRNVHPFDFLVLFVLGWLSVPIFSLLYYGVNVQQPGIVDPRRAEPAAAKPFKESYAYVLADHISQVSRLGFIVYAVDCLVVTSNALGFSLDDVYVSRAFAKIVAIVWIANRISRFKRHLLTRT